MSLATRCTACGTVFRVVQDQLRVSEGWVRCGRCAQVFNAAERLVDLDAEQQATRSDVQGLPQGGHRERVIDELGQISASGFDVPPADFGSADPHSAPTRRDSSPDMGGDGQHEALQSDFDDHSEPGRVPQANQPPAGPTAPPDLRAEPDEPPAFVRQADRAASWRRSPRRAALAGLVLLSAAALLAQAGLEYRDAMAARWTGLRPALEQVCPWTGCTVQAPRMIEALVVESSGLVRVDTTSMYRLSVALRNRASVDLAVPSIDLSLTDAQGRVVARRVLSLAELGHPGPQLAAGAEVPVKAVLSAAGPAITGYTIDVFYP